MTSRYFCYFFLPVTLRPKFLSLIHRWKKILKRQGAWGRDFVILSVAVLVMGGIYFGGLWTLEKLHYDIGLAYLPPTMALGIFLMVLMLMVFVANCVSTIAALYLDSDLEFVVTSPVQPIQFFIGKIIEIVLNASWMVIVFGIPVILVFGTFYKGQIEYYLTGIVVLFPFFAVIASTAIIIVTLFVCFVSQRVARFLSGAAALLLLYAVFYIFVSSVPAAGSFSAFDINDLLKVIAVLSLPNTSWTPSFWTATCLGELLEGTGTEVTLYFVLLVSSAFGMMALSFITLRCLYFRGYTKIQTARSARAFDSSRAQRMANKMLVIFEQRVRAIALKDYKTFLRDVTQSGQLLMLAVVVLFYLYGIRLIHSFKDGIAAESDTWWNLFLIISNIAMEAFLITSASTRFVFPSVSLEGRAYWTLRASPLTVSEYLRGKMYTWFFPIALVSSVIFSSSAAMLGASLPIILVKLLSTWLVCYGIVGLAIGLGAYYANFTWESASQLSSGFGNLVFMVAATVIIALNIVFFWVILFSREYVDSGGQFSLVHWYLLTVCMLFLFACINIIVARKALVIGERALSEEIDF